MRDPSYFDQLYIQFREQKARLLAWAQRKYQERRSAALRSQELHQALQNYLAPTQELIQLLKSCAQKKPHLLTRHHLSGLAVAQDLAIFYELPRPFSNLRHRPPPTTGVTKELYALEDRLVQQLHQLAPPAEAEQTMKKLLKSFRQWLEAYLIYQPPDLWSALPTDRIQLLHPRLSATIAELIEEQRASLWRGRRDARLDEMITTLTRALNILCREANFWRGKAVIQSSSITDRPTASATTSVAVVGTLNMTDLRPGPLTIHCRLFSADHHEYWHYRQTVTNPLAPLPIEIIIDPTALQAAGQAITIELALEYWVIMSQNLRLCSVPNLGPDLHFRPTDYANFAPYRPDIMDTPA